MAAYTCEDIRGAEEAAVGSDSYKQATVTSKSSGKIVRVECMGNFIGHFYLVPVCQIKGRFSEN